MRIRSIVLPLALLLPAACFAVPSAARAARLYFSAPELTQSLYAPFEVEVRLDSPDESVNAVDGSVELGSDVAAVVAAADGSSVVSLWLERPTPPTEAADGVRNAGRSVRFAGIVPGGFQGTGGKLFSFTISPRASGELPLSFASGTRVYLNGPDGQAADLSLDRTSVVVRSEKQPVFGVGKPDRDPPEPFQPALVQNSQLADGRWTLVFSTTDKRSGISHYDVWEQPGGWWGRLLPQPRWASATSPYPLQDQSLGRVLRVRAVDQAGNVRSATVNPAGAHRQLGYGVGAAVLLLLLGSYAVRHRFSSRR